MNQNNDKQSNNSADVLLSELESLLSITQTMFTAAKSDDWEQVIARESDRRSKIEAFFSSFQPENTPEQLRPAIEKLIAMDNEIVVLCQAMKDKISKSMKELNAGRQATSAYQKNTAP